jgi:P2X purinoceptor 7
MEKGALIMQRTSWNLVETLLLFLTQDHHGAHVEYANLCQLKKKINVARKSDVSHHLLHFKTLAQTGMCWSWLFEEGVRDIRAEEPDYSTNSFRKAAYRQYILWQYKKLGRGNRRVCPSCVVMAIRHIYPADDGVYMGFKRA